MIEATRDDKKNADLTDKEKERIVEELWLTYFNDTLYARGVISREAHYRMRRMIKARAASLEPDFETNESGRI